MFWIHVGNAPTPKDGKYRGLFPSPASSQAPNKKIHLQPRHNSAKKNRNVRQQSWVLGIVLRLIFPGSLAVLPTIGREPPPLYFQPLVGVIHLIILCFWIVLIRFHWIGTQLEVRFCVHHILARTRRISKFEVWPFPNEANLNIWGYQDHYRIDRTLGIPVVDRSRTRRNVYLVHFRIIPNTLLFLILKNVFPNYIDEYRTWSTQAQDCSRGGRSPATPEFYICIVYYPRFHI